MDLRKLEHFLAVVTLGRFHSAADACKVTQQAISKSVASIEAELGVKLFERTTSGAVPTTFGHALERRARRILKESRLAKLEVEAAKAEGPERVRVGMSHPMSHEIVAEAVTRFRRRRPNVFINVVFTRTPELFELLTLGQLDFAFTSPDYELSLPPDLLQEARFRHHDVIAARTKHPLVGRLGLTLADIGMFPWITPFTFDYPWNRLRQCFSDAGLAVPPEVARTNSLPCMIALLKSDDFLCFLDKDAFERGSRAIGLERLDVRGVSFTWLTFLTYNPDFGLSDASKRLITELERSWLKSMNTESV